MAIYVLFVLSPRLLVNMSIWNKPFVNMGTFSLGIYTVHFILLVLIVNLYHPVFSDSVTIFISFLTGLFVSWTIVWLLSRWKVTSVWMLGKI